MAKSIRKTLKRYSKDDNILKVEIISGKKIRYERLNREFCWSEISPSVGNILSKLCCHVIEKNINETIILENVLNEIISLTHSEIGNISIYQKNSLQSLYCLVLGEKIPGSVTPKEYEEYQKTAKNIFEKPIMTGRAIIINDCSKIDSLTDVPRIHPLIKTLLGIPLQYKNENIGVLVLANAQEYTVDDIRNILPLMKSITSLVKHLVTEKDALVGVVSKTSEVNEVKDRFLATISHELRTPLNGVVGMTTMLGDAGPLNDKQQEYVKNLTECSLQLASLLNNILDFSKMAANRLTLTKYPLNIHDITMTCIKMLEENIRQKGIELRIKIQEDIPRLMGDSQRIIQVLQNFLSNAYKFTEKGSIKITVKAHRISDFKKWKVVFSIKDTGVGIPASEQDKIFETFHQVATVDTYNSRCGTGLGLSIARELIRLMDGNVSFVSSEGKGSKFTFYIVLNESIDIDNMNIDQQNIITGKRILVIDDRAVMRLQLADMLFRWKCIPHVVSSAEEGIQCLEYGMTFDVVVVDICMPGMSGIDFAQKVRHEYPKLPLIGISSADIKSGQDYFDTYMNKPIEQNTLFSALIECLQHKKRKRTYRRRRKHQKHLKILIAEDDVHNIYTLSEMLQNIGFYPKNIDSAKDGLECIEKVKNKKFDVIFMDIKMPKMDGLEATKIIKKEYPKIFIVAVSAAVQPIEKAKGQKAGIDSYLSKPLMKDKLKAALSPLVKK